MEFFFTQMCKPAHAREVVFAGASGLDTLALTQPRAARWRVAPSARCVMVKSSMDQIARCRKGLIPPTHNEHRQQQNLKGIDEYEMDVEPVPEHARKAAQAAVARASRQAPSLVSAGIVFVPPKLSKNSSASTRLEVRGCALSVHSHSSHSARRSLTRTCPRPLCS